MHILHANLKLRLELQKWSKVFENDRKIIFKLGLLIKNSEWKNKPRYAGKKIGCCCFIIKWLKLIVLQQTATILG